MSVIGGSHNTGGEPVWFDHFAEFDRLPKPVRQQLAAAPYSYNPVHVAAAMRKHGMTGEEYAKTRMPAAFRRDVATKYKERRMPGMVKENP